MSYTIYDASIVAAKHLLTSLQGILTKAEAHPDAASHPDRRLAPEMLPLSFQIWSVCTVAEAQALTLQQKEAVTKQYEESPLPTYAAMRARIEQVLALLETVDRDAAVEAGEKMTSIDFKREVGRKELSGAAFCAGTGIPNMYFHTAIAYAILRNAGAPGMKPRVTATLWEDEGSLCFQVEARGICVARREDNHMINGTKLLNVAGMTRGRRDGILKSEKIRHVVKIGPMHLKGVWIPYERALEFANKEKITELLYPLFVHNIGSLLYHPTNQSRTNQVMAAADRRKQDQGQQMRTSSSHGLPSIHHQQQSAMAQVPGNQPTLASHSSLARPGLERAHTFPTPPTSASSVINGMGASEGFNWHSQGINGQQATTPPGTSLQSLQSYPSSAHGGYDSQRQMYTAPSTQQSPYQSTANSSQDRLYGQAAKSNGVIPSEQAAPQQPGDEEGEHEQETEYTHDSGSYDPTRASYNYSAPSALPSDSSNMPPEMTGSPNHPPASGRATPRTAAQPQSYYQHGGYTPPRVQQSSNLYNVMSNDRPTTNGATTGDVYAPAGEMPGSMNNGYAPRPVLNGVSAGVKRGRDDDEVTNNVGSVDLKRRKTMMETSVPAPVYDAMNQSASAVGAPPRR